MAKIMDDVFGGENRDVSLLRDGLLESLVLGKGILC